MGQDEKENVSSKRQTLGQRLTNFLVPANTKFHCADDGSFRKGATEAIKPKPNRKQKKKCSEDNPEKWVGTRLFHQLSTHVPACS